MTRRFALLIALVLPVFLSCATTGPGGKTDIILISDEEEVSIGQQVDAEVRATNRIYGDAEWQRYFNEVGQRIVKVCDRQEIEYHFAIIDSNVVNAFATPGGYIYFYTGILKLMDSEAELAAVLGHEISHVVARHSVKHLQKAVGVSILVSIALGDRAQGTWGQVLGVLYGLWANGYGRTYELEADEYGVFYMKEAGYNPDGARSMFKKLSELSGSGQQGFFERLTTSHPDTQERLGKIDAQIAAMPRTVDALPKYEERYATMKRRLPTK